MKSTHLFDSLHSKQETFGTVGKWKHPDADYIFMEIISELMEIILTSIFRADICTSKLQEELWVLYQQAATAGAWRQVRSSGFLWVVIYAWLCPSSRHYQQAESTAKVQERAESMSGISALFFHPLVKNLMWAEEVADFKLPFLPRGTWACINQVPGKPSAKFSEHSQQAAPGQHSLIQPAQTMWHNQGWTRIERGHEQTGFVEKGTRPPDPLPVLVFQEAVQRGGGATHRLIPWHFWLIAVHKSHSAALLLWDHPF